MDKQVRLDETIEVERPLKEVFAYISEFARIEEWDPAVASAQRLTDGSVGVDSEFRVNMKQGFSLRYRVVEFEPERRMLMNVDSAFFSAVEEILFDATAGGTRVRYIATFDFPLPLAAVSRLFPSVMDRVGKDTMAGMKRALEDRFAPPQASRAVEIADRLVLPGIWRFSKLGYRRARRHWNAVSGYLGDKHVVVTGATSGIGLAAATALAGLGAHVTLVARNADKARQAKEEIKRKTGNTRITVELADLSLIKDVNALADRLLARGKPIHVLVNNAGALINPRQVTAEGYEKSFALLLLSPYVLTERLQPLLKKARGARVVNVSSGGMYSQKVHVDDLQNREGKYSGAVAYARAKRGLMILTEEWAKRWKDDDIAVNAMHPGWADTPGVESSLPEFYRLTRSILRTPEEGADTVVWLAAATEAGKVSGKLWLDRAQHPAYVFAHTRETAEDRERLLAALKDYEKAARGADVGTPRKSRRKSA